MITKQKVPTLSALIIFYLLALGMLFMFGPSVMFFFKKQKVQGVVTEINAATVDVIFDYKGEEYRTNAKRKYKNKGIIKGDKVEVLYKKNDPTNVRVPTYEGNEPYLISFILIIMALGGVFSMHRAYIKG